MLGKPSIPGLIPSPIINITMLKSAPTAAGKRDLGLGVVTCVTFYSDDRQCCPGFESLL